MCIINEKTVPLETILISSNCNDNEETTLTLEAIASTAGTVSLFCR